MATHRGRKMPNWEIGDRYTVAGVGFGNGPEKCVSCRGSEPIWVGQRDINGTRMMAHVHRTEEPWYGNGPDKWQIMEYSPGHPRLVAEVYSQEDAELIVASVHQGSTEQED